VSASPSWAEQPGDLPAELVQALRGAPSEPSQVALELLASRLGSSLGLSLAVPQAPLATKALVVAKPALGLVGSTLLGVALGVGLSAAVAVSFGVGRQPESVASAVTLPVTPPLPPTVVAPLAEPPVSEPRLEAPSHGSGRAPSPSVTASADVSPLDVMAAELALLRQARAVLASNPSRALALCADHARMFDGGALSQEREVIAIEALLGAGRAGEARERGRRFRESFPGSAHARRIDSLLEAADKP
jgi:hypothetical protein